MRCSPVRLLATLALAAISSPVAGCSAPSDATGPDASAGDAGSEGTRTPRTPPRAPDAIDVPFNDVFVASSAWTCSDRGISDFLVTLPKGEYQFSDCVFRVTPGDLAKGDIAIDVEDTFGAGSVGERWETTVTPVDAVPGELSVRVRQPRRPRDWRDWNDRPLAVRFDFATAKGERLSTHLAVRPAASSRIATFQTPRISVGRVVDQTIGGVTGQHVWPPRRDAAGTLVRRIDEGVSFEIPFELGANVQANAIGGLLHVEPNVRDASDPCVFGDLVDTVFPAGLHGELHSGWSRESGAFLLDVTGVGSDAWSACAARPPAVRGALSSGVFWFDPALGDLPLRGSYVHRVASTDISTELAFRVTDDASAGTTIEATNVADYGIYSLAPRVTIHCVGGADTSFTGPELPAPTTANGTTEHAIVAPGAKVSFRASDLRAAFAAQSPSDFDACASGRFTTSSVVLVEGAGFASGSATTATSMAFSK